MEAPQQRAIQEALNKLAKQVQAEGRQLSPAEQRRLQEEEYRQLRGQLLHAVLFPDSGERGPEQPQTQEEVDPLNQAYLDLADAQKRIEEIQKQRAIDNFMQNRSK
jgi:hypothetical protein